ncbi:hypothetical protein CR203_22465 [Salipaludibacillus neizhouensis]|uniref:Uncharacterized protein n=1 Tax=Salipaludibacillus neizhouensis TaxID=885475 RepID=A0A3A9KCK4_9BACI|nr:hypothetical protein [Salipaludibacillus neizhouensis]RKL65115.1 hypothetical protein CR203_22465 [Salipaludibacillus neizhouensis]
MSKNKWNEKDIEKTLSNLPSVKDKQSKDELFQAIEKRSEEVSLSRAANKRKKSWLFPALGSVAAIFIILLVIPSFINNNSQMSMDEANDSAENMESSSADNAENKVSLYSDDSGNETQESSIGTESQSSPRNDENASSNNNEATQENNSSVDVRSESNSSESIQEEEPVQIEDLTPSEFIAQIIPVEESDFPDGIAVLHPTEIDHTSTEELLATSLKASDPTIRSEMENITEVSLDEQLQDSVHLNFQEDHNLESLTSSEHQGLGLIFQELFTIYGIDEVELSVEGEPGIMFGQQGEVESLPIDLFNRGYYSYEKDGEVYLVSARIVGEQMRSDSGNALTYRETVERMAAMPDEHFYTSPVPDFVEVVNFRFDDKFVEVIYETEGPETEESQLDEMSTFYDSLILTAEPFSLDTLQITNETTGETKEVDLN